MTDRDKKIMEYLGESEMLSQLAEECCELGQAALKLRRVLYKKNPTPNTEEEARRDLIEEAADVYNVLGFLLGVDEHIQAYNIIQKKKDRWLGRIEEAKMMAEVIKETKEEFGGMDE
jgi:NTP pyrophosphatase (non-canonical NTP hydrolase)